MVWFSGPVDPAVTEGVMEFWLDEEHLLTVQIDHVNFLPVEGMYITYQPLVGSAETYRVGDVTIILAEDRTAGYPPDPPDPAIPGSIFLRPTIKVVMQTPP